MSVVMKMVTKAFNEDQDIGGKRTIEEILSKSRIMAMYSPYKSVEKFGCTRYIIHTDQGRYLCENLGYANGRHVSRYYG